MKIVWKTENVSINAMESGIFAFSFEYENAKNRVLDQSPRLSRTISLYLSIGSQTHHHMSMNLVRVIFGSIYKGCLMNL